MKIKTTMLSGVAGALVLASFLTSSTMYGAAHSDPAVVNFEGGGSTTLLDPDTDTTIIGDISMEGYLTVDGTVTIQATADGSTAYTFDNDGAGVNPDIPTDLGTLINPIANTTPVYTQVGNTTTAEADLSGTGIIAETNGDLTLLSDQGTEMTFTYVRAVRNDIYNADQPNPGDTAQVLDVGGYVDPDTGIFVELGLLDLAENWDASYIGTPLQGQLILDPTLVLTTEQEALLTATMDIPGSGGNLLVGGTATVDGNTSLMSDLSVAGNADIDGTLELGAIADVETSINTNTQGIMDNTAAIDQEVIDRTAADDALDVRLTANEELAGNLNYQINFPGGIQETVDELSELIYLDENGATHIGPDSLVTQYDSADDDQNLWAENPDGDIIDINAVTNINVSPAALPGTEVSITAADGQVNPTIDPDLQPVVSPVSDTTPVYTLLSEVTESETDYTQNGGVLLETNGNVTLTSSEGTRDTLKYVTAVRADIYNADQGAVAGTTAQEVRVGGYLDANGDFVELAVLEEVNGQWLLDDDFVPTTEQEATLTALGYWTADEDISGEGGDLWVGGDATVMGKLAAGGIADVETAINDNSDAIEDEEAARMAADTTLQNNIDAEATARADADDDLQSQIDDNVDTLDVHFGLVSKNITDIASNSSRISSLETAMQTANMEIETNRRGIAMVAALTHTTILPGMENALDISLAYFEGETGVSLSYSRRINENTQINFAAASTSDFEESVVRGGIGWQW